jgi:hypothetical protein
MFVRRGLFNLLSLINYFFLEEIKRRRKTEAVIMEGSLRGSIGITDDRLHT